jgi:hypothetical protein
LEIGRDRANFSRRVITQRSAAGGQSNRRTDVDGAFFFSAMPHAIRKVAHDRKVTGDDADERAAAAVGKKQSTINVVEGL